MKVMIKFMGTGYNDKYQAKVKIYDRKRVVFDGYSYNGIVKVCLKKNKVYRVEAMLFNQIIRTSIYIKDNKYVLWFRNAYISYRAITLSLRDYFYNLPIEKGVIMLWQK